MMGLRLIYRSLRQHALGLVVTALGIGLATGLLTTVWVLKTQAASTFERSTGGYDAVLGARGSKLQIVLNALFHLDKAPGTLRAEDFETLAKNPAVALAIPLASGDNYRGWRIVGSSEAIFGAQGTASDNKEARLPLAQGRYFHPAEKELVVGGLAAKTLGLSLGDHLHPSHGAGEGEGAEHEEVYEVVGILKETNSPADRVLWIPLEGVQHMSGHDPIYADELTAVLLKFRSPAAGFAFDRQYNQPGGRLTLAFPAGSVVAELFLRFSWMEKILSGIAWLVVLVAAGSILAAITNTLEGRRRDMAILRSLGANRAFLFRLLLGEAAITGALGALAGILFHALLSGLCSLVVRGQTGVSLDAWHWNAVFLWGPVAVVGMSVLSGLWPAFRVHQTDVTEALVPPS